MKTKDYVVHIETTTPQLNTVRVEVVNLTDRQTRFLRSIIEMLTLGGPRLDAVESAKGLMTMSFDGEIEVTPQL